VIKDYIGTVALIMIPLGAFLVFWAAFLKRAYKDVPMMKSRDHPLQFSPKPVRYIVVAFVLLAIAVHWGPRHNGKGGISAPPVAGAARNAQEKGKTYEPHFRWLPLLVLGSIVLGIGGSMVLMTRQHRRTEAEPDALRVTVAEVLEETLDDLVREPDPRVAVIGAYAKMERTLAARGFPREESEAPGEYLARILEVAGAGGHSARRITSLFERARFSEHEIDSAMKQDAIESLTGLRAELLVAT
jgi:hypothetical protein